MIIRTLLANSLLAASASLLLPIVASAQVNGIASADPVEAIFAAKAWSAANAQIETTYKTQVDQIGARQQQLQTLLAQLDKNGDMQLDDAELQAARAASSPILAQADAIEHETQQLSQPIVLAQAYVLDTIAQRFQTALQTVIKARKVSIVLLPDAIVYAPPMTYITQAIIAEIDRTLPVAVVTPPPGWQVTAQGAQLFQHWQQMIADRAAAAPPLAAAVTPPAEAPAARPPATQQPSTR